MTAAGGDVLLAASAVSVGYPDGPAVKQVGAREGWDAERG